YEKVIKATVTKTIIIPEKESPCREFRTNDKTWSSFLSSKKIFSPKATKPETPISVFTNADSSVTWNHTTPIKMAADGFYHINIQPCDTVCFPTDFNHCISSWLIFSTLINQGTIALYYDCPEKNDFSKFVTNAEVNILGSDSKLISDWYKSKNMEGTDWPSIKHYISTGDNRDIDSAKYLMELNGEPKPIIEYRIHPELSGAYLTGTMIRKVFPCQFSTPALGTELLIEEEQQVKLQLPQLGYIPNSIQSQVHTSQLQLNDKVERLPEGYFKLRE
ncbi:MAG: hypothetical protein NE330_11805, partial [Lentisphaeraceae bacterium]|nr:hypothetical protein [Lentisphaeraceae bacterium]